jgi:hypothetical protein
MGLDDDGWHEGRRAWERLRGWEHGSVRGHAKDGEGAVDALGDIARMRHLLDQAELVAVRTARRYRKSWAEIATRLGVTRQAAWERWRELDDAPATQQGTDVEALLDAEAARLVDRKALEMRRRRSVVVVPNVVGMTWDEARHVLMDVQLVAVGPDPDRPPLSAMPTIGVVTDQSPESGAKVPAGSAVILWIGRGGGYGGVREPRNPTPPSRASRASLDEPAGEALG